MEEEDLQLEHFQDLAGDDILQDKQKMSNCVLKYLVYS